jgi:class 3 adenylate cyclase/ketosteroid isomerase-like protein
LKPSREIRDCVLGVYHDMAEGRVPDTFSMSPDAVFLGTGPGEVWVGGQAIRTALQVQNEELGLIKVVPGTIRAYEEGTVGWASDESTLILPDGTTLPIRLTLVFHRENGEWQIIHGHGSNISDNLEYWGTDMDLSMDRIATLVRDERPDLGPLTSTEGTVTIMFTDLESSTATNESMGDDAFLPLLLKHNEIVRTRTAESGGSVVKSQGDGFMLAFPSARRAVECATTIQREVATVDERLKVRMGLHTGEPVRQADDFYGRDVAYAARIGSAANGGEVLVSSLVKSLVEPSGSVTFAAARELALKGFDGLQTVFAVDWRDR